MKKFFYIGIIGLALFEIANIYFIMPMPSSQEMRSIGLAYFLYSWRWALRSILGIMTITGFSAAWKSSKWWPVFWAALAVFVGYQANFEMAADKMFVQPQNLQMKPVAVNQVPDQKLVMGLVVNNQARAYPIQYMGYHHQVLDTVGGEPVMVTYCTVCRTGRVYQPLVNGKPEQFRLVGMDHFNAMFEDATTHSWWRQGTGEAIAGSLTGQMLPELPYTQTTLREWLLQYPGSLIMQPDTALFGEEYKDMNTYDAGKGRGKLTGMDSLSWNKKSWVVGIIVGADSKAFDWNRLRKERIIQDAVGKQPVVLVLAADTLSFFAFARPSADAKFILQNDTLRLDNQPFNLKGEPLGNSENVPHLRRIQAYQEFWHSWSTFHPNTGKY